MGLFISILLVSFVYADLDLPKYKGQYYEPGVLIVKFKEKPILNENKALDNFKISFDTEILTSKTGKQAFNPKKPKGKHFVENIYIFEYDQNKDISKLITKVQKNPDVEWVEPDYLFEDIFSIPNDQYYPQQWNFPKTSAPDGWNIETGSKEILIATIDTGIDWKHEDLAEKVWNNPGEDADGDGHTIEYNSSEWVFDEGDLNEIDDDGNDYVDDLIGWDSVSISTDCALDEDCDIRDSDPLDRYGHGTFQFGLMGAHTNNNFGIAGVCWGCSLLALRAGYRRSNGHMGAFSIDIADSINYATDNNAKALNFATGAASSTIYTAIQYAYSNGVFLSAAVGNSGTEGCLGPSQYAEIMAIGGTDAGDNRWVDVGGGSNWGSCVEVSAPANNLYSTWPSLTYTTGSGTSYSSPQVTGLAGLILSKNPTLTNEQVRSIIKNSADNITTDHPIGGRINVSRALQMTPTLEHPCSGKDFNNDSKVDWLDTGVFSGCYGSNITINPGCERSDFNDDGKVTYLDIGPFSACYGSSW